MRKYVEPEMRIKNLCFDDIICSSNPEEGNKDIIESDNDGPEIPEITIG